MPLIGFDLTSVIGSDKISITKKVSEFLDEEVESKIIDYFISEDSISKSSFYNTKIIGAFKPGHISKRSPKSGSKKKSLCFSNQYAWESLSLAAAIFESDRKTINSRIENKLLRELAEEEFANFPGLKFVSEEESINYFENKQDEFSKLKKTILAKKKH